MADVHQTRPSLLVRLRDPKDSTAWARFVTIYRPLLHAYARRAGLQDADASDVAQDVLRIVSQAMPRFEYDPDRGAFRGWLFAVARNALLTHLAKARRPDRGSGRSSVAESLASAPGPIDDQALFERDYQKRTFDWAAAIVREEFEPATWRAFWRTAIDLASAKEVADELGTSVGAVYVAKSRVLARLRALVRSVEGE